MARTIDTNSAIEEPRAALRARFGWEEFRPGQEEVIGHLLAGRSAAAVFPTGAGKSLCYQLPALLLPGLTLVVSPLIALMKDQIDQLRAKGIAAARMDSSLSAEESRGVWSAVERGDLRLLYVAPERFNNERFRELIQRTRVSLFAVDEAHCISEWGHNFRPDYLKLARFAELCGTERILALTATATPRVLDDICRGFGVKPECAVRTGFYRPNLTIRVTPVAAAERDLLLLARLRERPPGPAIVYVTLQRTAEQVAAQLTADGLSARAYHAGMEDTERATVQDWFIGSDRAIVVATIAFGMGIDKADIRYVYHYNAPKSIENFSQEIGRSGRDGRPSTCELFLCPDDLITLENFVYGDTPSLPSIRSFLDEVFSPTADELEFSLAELSTRHDIRQLVVRTLFAYLELDGYLEEGTPYSSSYQFRPLATSAEILGHFQGEQRDFLVQLFRQARQARVWFHIDLEAAARATGQPRDRFVRALDYLDQQGWIELKAEGVRSRFRRLRATVDLSALAEELAGRTLDRETRELARLQELLDLATGDRCVVGGLSAHFGEMLPGPCGHCSWCLDTRAAEPLARTEIRPDEASLRQASALRNEHPDSLMEPRAFARFLCGLSSPRASRARLGSHPLFGSCADIPFAQVLDLASA